MQRVMGAYSRGPNSVSGGQRIPPCRIDVLLGHRGAVGVRHTKEGKNSIMKAGDSKVQGLEMLPIV